MIPTLQLGGFGLVHNPVAGGGGLLLTDMVAHWDLSESSGQRNDSHTNALHLSDVNTVGSSTGVDGVSTCALFDSASAEMLSRAHNTLFNPDDEWFVANVWAYRTGTNNAYPPVLGKGLQATDTNGGWQIAEALSPGSNSQIDYTEMRSAGNDRILISPAGDANASTWYMYTFAHDPVANLIRLYRNGTQLGTAAVSGGSYANTGDLMFFGDSNRGTYLSGRSQCATIWKGAGAETVLSHLTWLYNSGTAPRTYADISAYGG